MSNRKTRYICNPINMEFKYQCHDCSANVDEHNRLFDLTMQGRLSDVFGVRTSAFECPVTHFSNTNECGLQKRKLDLRRENPRIKFNGELLDFSIDYYEIVERLSAKASSK